MQLFKLNHGLSNFDDQCDSEVIDFTCSLILFQIILTAILFAIVFKTSSRNDRDKEKGQIHHKELRQTKRANDKMFSGDN